MPEDWEHICYEGTKAELERVNKAMLTMGKIDREELIQAIYGK